MTGKCIVCGKNMGIIKKSRLERTKTGVTCSRECRAEHFKAYYRGPNNPNAYKCQTPLEAFFRDKENKLRHTAQQRNISFTLTADQLLTQYNKQNGLCYYTGIPLSLVTTKDWTNKKQADLEILSVDRINSNLGYTANNIVLCCNAINKMKGTAKLLEVQGFLNYIASQRTVTCHMNVKKLRDGAILPERAKLGDAGYDLSALEIEDLGDGRIKVKTGIAVQLSEGWYCEVYSRSSNTKKGIMLMNSVGIIDNGYTGEIFLIFFKTRSDATINVGDRVAQLIPKQYAMVKIEEVDSLEQTQRGDNGFGSTGTGSVGLKDTKLNDPKNALANMKIIREFNEMQKKPE